MVKKNFSVGSPPPVASETWLSVMLLYIVKLVHNGEGHCCQTFAARCQLVFRTRSAFIDGRCLVAKNCIVIMSVNLLIVRAINYFLSLAKN